MLEGSVPSLGTAEARRACWREGGRRDLQAADGGVGPGSTWSGPALQQDLALPPPDSSFTPHPCEGLERGWEPPL